VSIEVWEGSVLLGVIVVASSVALPSRMRRCSVGASNAAMASGRSPSTEISTTWRVRLDTGSAEASSGPGAARTYRAVQPVNNSAPEMAVAAASASSPWVFTVSSL
jgi:hypothetical protein